MTPDAPNLKTPSLASFKVNNFDQLRLILATMVIFDHSFGCVGRNEPLDRLSIGRFHLGTIAVYCFFVLSGYLVTNSWNHSSGALDFIRKRCLRIYPALICSLFLSLLVFAPLGGCNLPQLFATEDPYKFIAAPLIFSGFQFTTEGFCRTNYYALKLNIPLWTIRFEILCYLILLALGTTKLLRKSWTMPVLLALCMLWTFHWSAPTIPYFGYLFNLPLLIAFFISGACLLQFEVEIANIVKPSMLIAALLAVVIWLVPGHGTFDCFSLPILGTYILWLLAINPKLHFYDSRRLGDYSYGLYIYAFPIQQLIVHFHPRVKPLMLFASSWALTFAVAFVSWHLVEKPFLKLKKNSTQSATN